MKITCINCQKEFNVISNTFLCPSCNYLNPLNDIDFFSYLGLKKRLFLNLDELETQFMLLMQKYHPDNFVNKPEQEKINSLAHSGYLNKAYDTLKEETSRFAYLYELENKKSIVNEVDTNNSKLFMEFFEYYEELENVKNANDLISFQNKLKKLKKDILLENEFINFSNKDIAYNIYLKLKYIDKIIESSKNKKLEGV